MTQTAVVTGAASGIGRALATVLAEAGLSVMLADLDADKVEAAAESLKARGYRAKGVALNVTDAEAFKRVIEQAGDRLDYLFNNAGVGLAGEVQAMSLEDWKRLIDINIGGVINGITAAYPQMIEQGFGHIVNTASGAGLAPRPGMTAYAATKHAVVGLSTSLRAEAAALGVKVSVLCPGYIQTNILKSTKFLNVDGAKLMEKVPIKPMTAQRCAEITWRRVLANRAIIVMSAYSWLDWWLYRLSPALAINAAKLRAQQFRNR